VPDWLTPNKGFIVDFDAATKTYTYQFSKSDLEDTGPDKLTWSTERTFNASPEIATLSWQAIHTEITNYEQAFSEIFTFSVTKTPLAVAPDILGPSVYEILEGTGAIKLSDFTVDVLGFTSADIENTVRIYADLGKDLKLTYGAGKSYDPSIGLKVSDLASAVISAKDPDFASDPSVASYLTFSLRATQSIGTSTATSAESSVDIVIENIPEDVTIASSIKGTTVDLSEGNALALPVFTVSGAVDGETVFKTLSLASGFTLEERYDEYWFSVVADLSTTEGSTYNLDTAALEANNYQIRARTPQ